MLAKLPYSEKYRFGASPGASGYTFNLNDPNDPWQGIGNPSATNFQLLGSYYKWCTVYGVKVSCTYYQRSISGGLIQQGVYMFMIPYTNYTPVPAVDDDIFTTRWVSYKMVGNTNTRVYRQKRYLDFNKLSGNNQVSKDPTEYAVNCANGTAPNTKWYMLLTQYPVREGDGVIELDVNVRLTYYCKFWELRKTWSS